MYILNVYTKMKDLFDNKIFCSKCNLEMQKIQILKNGFLLRAIKCPLCLEKIIHPADDQDYQCFSNLKNKEYKVKMRLVGNSYAVSIPKEIVSFMKQQEKIINDMVNLCFEEANKLSLKFDTFK